MGRPRHGVHLGRGLSAARRRRALRWATRGRRRGGGAARRAEAAAERKGGAGDASLRGGDPENSWYSELVLEKAAADAQRQFQALQQQVMGSAKNRGSLLAYQVLLAARDETVKLMNEAQRASVLLRMDSGADHAWLSLAGLCVVSPTWTEKEIKGGTSNVVLANHSFLVCPFANVTQIDPDDAPYYRHLFAGLHPRGALGSADAAATERDYECDDGRHGGRGHGGGCGRGGGCRCGGSGGAGRGRGEEGLLGRTQTAK